MEAHDGRRASRHEGWSKATPPFAASEPALLQPIAAVAEPDAVAAARSLAQSAWTLPGEIVEEAITTGGASAREAAGRGLVALQDAGNAGSPVQARVTGMENGVPAFQGGTLSGPLGAVNVAEGGGDGLEATASLQPAAGIGVVMQQRPDGAAAGHLGQGGRRRPRRRPRPAAHGPGWGQRGRQTQRRQQLSVDVVPGLTVETSRALSWSGREDDDRIGVKWMLRY